MVRLLSFAADLGRVLVLAPSARMQEVVVGGWRPGQGRRAETVGSLLLGVGDGEGRLHYIGRVGTGFSVTSLT